MTDITTRQEAIQVITTSDKVYLTPADVAPILGSDPHTIRCTARQRPDMISYEFTFVGNRMKIPRIPFLRWLGANPDCKLTQEAPDKSDNIIKPPMTNEELLLAITQEINTFKQEINTRLDNIESQTHDLNNVLQSARRFINALCGTMDDR